MKNINRNISIKDKLQIYMMIFSKLIRGFLYRWRFKSVKGLLLIGKRVDIYNSSKIELGKNVKLESGSEIQGLSTKGIKFGNDVTIGRDTMIRPSSYYGVGRIGDGFEIGNNSSIGPMGYIGCAGQITIGKNVMIGPKVSMFAENHNFNDSNSTIKEQGVSNKGIIIEDNCWIGSSVTILDGVTIGSGSVIAASTVVTKNVPKNSIVMDKKDKQVNSR
ncbi:acyltransferase [Latilactobacillus sakei]